MLGETVVVDALLGPLVLAVTAVLSWLPVGQALAIGPVESVWTAVRQFDSLIPVLGPLTAMLGLLGVLAGFLVVRVVLVLWNLIYP